MATRARVKKASSKRVVAKKNKGGLSEQNWPMILAVLVILIGLFSAVKGSFVDPSEAAINRDLRMSRPEAGSETVQRRSKQEQAWVDEAINLWHVEHNKCFFMPQGPERCDCLKSVLAKFQELRDRILADGQNHDDFIAFWVDYYMKLIREDMKYCDDNISGASSATTSGWTKFLGRLRL